MTDDWYDQEYKREERVREKRTHKTEPEYRDREGNRVTLEQLCRLEPEWAAHTIRFYKRQLSAVLMRQTAHIVAPADLALLERAPLEEDI